MSDENLRSSGMLQAIDF